MRRKILLLDMDGVLVKDKALNPFPDTLPFLDFLRSEGIPFRVVSNNSTRPPSTLLEDLSKKGINLKEDELITPLKILPVYLRQIHCSRLLVIGSPLLAEFLVEEGFQVVEDQKVDAVVIGQDRNINFTKLKLATSAVFLESAKIVPVNHSRIVRDDDGLYFPGAGSLAHMLAHACRYSQPIPNLGKPSEEFMKLALSGMEGDEVYLVSDDLYTDLVGAKEQGIKTIFITTGKYSKEELTKANFEPHYVVDSLTELMELLKTL